MLEWANLLIQEYGEFTVEWLKLMVQQYGLLGLLFSSFLGSTIFLPLSVELTFPVLVRSGVHKIAIVWFAALGSLTGTFLNYVLGYMGIKYVYDHTRKEEVGRARRFMDRYGWAGVFVALAFPVPLPVDPITVLCGASKMNPLEFTAVVFTAKLLKYSLWLGIVSIVF